MDEPWDLPDSEFEESAGWVESAAEENPRVDEASSTYIGSWNRLVSTTNWEKGRILSAWREELIAMGASSVYYSDEAWSRRVGGVTPQHVGRLRRVFERFHDTHTQYEGLYWSHFHAALDWDDAEMWLEGAMQSGWSVSAMRSRRGETLGASTNEDSRGEDLLPVASDEDADDSVDAVPEILRSSTALVEPVQEEQNEQDETGLSDGASLHAQGLDDGDGGNSAPGAKAIRPFEDLPELPDDLAEAVETLKLAIVRHKLAGWREVRADDVLAALRALGQLALAPADAS